MKAFAASLAIQFRLDVRDRGTLLTYYLVPLLFYFVMGAVFSAINPVIRETLTASMGIFAVTMGTVLGMPVPLVKMRETGILRSYRVSGIPRWSVYLAQSVSTGLHLLIVALVIFVTAPLLYGAVWPDAPFVWMVVLLALLFASLSLGLLIGVLARSQAVAMMLSQAVFLPTMMFSGIMFPTEMLPQPLQAAGRILPATWLMMAFQQGAYKLAAPVPLWLCLLAGIGIGLAALAAAAWRSRHQAV
ncbi:MAG: ABC transporter permease [Clostridiales bacterium]|nr:ABC transporter permease [Clostridiales bacterium]